MKILTPFAALILTFGVAASPATAFCGWLFPGWGWGGPSYGASYQPYYAGYAPTGYGSAWGYEAAMPGAGCCSPCGVTGCCAASPCGSCCGSGSCGSGCSTGCYSAPSRGDAVPQPDSNFREGDDATDRNRGRDEGGGLRRYNEDSLPERDLDSGREGSRERDDWNPRGSRPSGRGSDAPPFDDTPPAARDSGGGRLPPENDDFNNLGGPRIDDPGFGGSGSGSTGPDLLDPDNDLDGRFRRSNRAPMTDPLEDADDAGGGVKPDDGDVVLPPPGGGESLGATFPRVFLPVRLSRSSHAEALPLSRLAGDRDNDSRRSGREWAGSELRPNLRWIGLPPRDGRRRL